MLATATFADETASGWQSVSLLAARVAVRRTRRTWRRTSRPERPVLLTANQFGLGPVDNPPLHTLASGTDGPNGVFRSGTTGYPGNSFGNTNYWVDVVFAVGASAPLEPQTITFGALGGVNYGNAPVTVSASGGASGNPVTFTTSTPTVCTEGGTNGSTITIVGAGTCTVTASQGGNTAYAAAIPVSQSFAVTPAPLVVTASNGSKVYGANPWFATSITGFVLGQTLANRVSVVPQTAPRPPRPAVGSARIPSRAPSARWPRRTTPSLLRRARWP